jgi:hypothetical protein
MAFNYTLVLRTLIITHPQVPWQQSIALGAGRVDDDVMHASDNGKFLGLSSDMLLGT